ncbi:MAG: hypothetical protein N2202_04810 [Proteobacteria bacterium]|nr:hypothetical protein [Pseudomonadota bacterium]
MKKLIIIFLLFAIPSFAKEKDQFDVNIEKSLEIFGAEEKPRIIFVLPEYNIEFRAFKTDKGNLIELEKILERDLINKQ